MQCPNWGISYDLEFYNFVCNIPKTFLNIFFQANANLQYSNMGDEKYLIMFLNIVWANKSKLHAIASIYFIFHQFQ